MKKLKLVALAAVLAASGAANAAISNSASGDADLVASFRFYNGNGTTATGGVDMSATFNLGLSVSDILANQNVAGYTQTWNLNDISFGSAWESLKTFAGTAVANIEWTVFAGDVNGTVNRLLVTSTATTISTSSPYSLTNSGITAVNNPTDRVQNYINAASAAMDAAGTDAIAVDNSAGNAYFGNMGGAAGDSLGTRLGSSADITKNLATAQNFFYLVTAPGTATTQVSKSAFGYDLNGDGTLQSSEYAKWSVDLAANTLTFANPVPEPESFAMLLAGLGLMGAVARRRRNAV